MGFKDFTNASDKRALEKGEELARDLDILKCGNEETIAYLGLSYVDLETRFGCEAAFALYEKKQRQAFLPLTVLERILTEINPDLVVATNSPRAEQAAITVAGRRNIPSICIIDLLGRTEVAWIGKPGYATKL